MPILCFFIICDVHVDGLLTRKFNSMMTFAFLLENQNETKSEKTIMYINLKAFIRLDSQDSRQQTAIAVLQKLHFQQAT
jgi:division protein CdvB (Snf7/Vps24/ESCRT-III family)